MRALGLWIAVAGMLAGGAVAAEEPCHDGKTTAHSSSATTPSLSRAEQLSRAGADAFDRGDFQSAAIAWQQAVDIYRAGNATEQFCRESYRLGTAYQFAGRYDSAATTLQAALDVATTDPDRMRLLAALGRLQTYQGKLAAMQNLERATELAKSLGDLSMEGSILNDRGNLSLALASTARATEKPARYSEACELYEESIRLAEDCRDTKLLAMARTNLVRALQWSGQSLRALAAFDDALASVQKLPASYERAHLLLSLGQSTETLAETTSPANAALLRRAFDAYHDALAVADRIGSDRIASYAWGYRGQLYEICDQTNDALAATRKAIFLAQKIGAPEALYRWEWQLGRIYAAAGMPDQAIAAYQRSIDSVKQVRNDIALYGARASGAGFRDSVAPVFYGLADLLLQQDRLTDARDVIEDLKAAELEDYFQDECLDLIKSERVDISQVLKGGEAILYIIPLRDRSELLLSLPGQTVPQRFTSPVTNTQLSDLARTFRTQLGKRVSYESTQSAKLLYDALIRPAVPVLREQKVDTLIFIPDGELRTIPFAALRDAQSGKYLIQEFAVAVSPGLNVTQAPDRSRRRDRVQVLAAGLSVAKDGFPALQFVPIELGEIGKLYNPTTLQDSTFTKAAFNSEFDRTSYTIVHIASHGEFSADIEDTFILTSDDRLKLNDLQKVIQPSQFRDRPVDLLTLSACETAKGSDSARAALGLAGVAVKAGARSALATLWKVDDEAASTLVADFYKTLKEDPNISKAKALQAAQRRFIENQPDSPDSGKYEPYGVPFFWAGFEIIGNWL